MSSVVRANIYCHIFFRVICFSRLPDVQHNVKYISLRMIIQNVVLYSAQAKILGKNGIRTHGVLKQYTTD